jgi:hypothetical protein
LSATDSFSATIAGAPRVTVPIAHQHWMQGAAFAVTLPANTFTDPQGESLTYTASLSNGQALPSWLNFNAATDSFSGTAPSTAETLTVVVTATDSSGLSASDPFFATILGAPTVTAQTANQTWTENAAVSLRLPANTFTDPQGESLTYSATLSNGQALPGWLSFNPATDSFSGTAPGTSQSLAIKVTAQDSSGLSASETFSATVQPPAQPTQPTQNGNPPLPGITVTAPTPNQSWTDGQSVDFALPADTFTDALGLKMSFIAYQLSGPNVTSWLHFDPSTDTLFGQVPASETGSIQLAIFAVDALHMVNVDVFNVSFAAGAGHIAAISATNAYAIGGAIAPGLQDTPLLASTLLAGHI